jgi:hypothetical protein
LNIFIYKLNVLHKWLHNEELNDLFSLPNIVRGMWRVCGRREECTGCLWENLRERGHWGDPDVDWRIILRLIFRKLGGGCGDWMESAQDRDRWRAPVSTVKNLRVPEKCGEFLD